ncbi:MAG: histidine kinase [Saprospiraceae bacterium]
MFLYFIVGLSSLSIIGFYSYFKAKKALISRSFEQLNTVRSIKQFEIEKYFAEHQTANNENSINYFEINKILQDTVSKKGLCNYESIYLFNENLGRDYKTNSSQDNYNADIIKSQCVLEAINNDSENAICKDCNNEKTLCSFKRLNIDGKNLILVASLSFKKAMIPIINLRNDLLFVSFIITILIFSIAQVLSNDILTPIMELIKVSKEIGKGNLNSKVNINSKNEFKELESTFNQMADDIEKNTIELVHEKEKRITALYDGQEFERQRISRDLHDGLAQHLIGIKMTFENLIDKNIIIENKEVSSLKSQISNSIEELRKISYDLAPSNITDFNLAGAIENMCIQIQKSNKLIIEFSSFGDFSGLDKRSKTYLYRIVQEALNNTIKHARATKVDIQLTETKELYFLIIEDNGIGFDLNNNDIGLGHGLFNIKERSILLNGTFDIETYPDGGTTLRIKLSKKKNDE